MVMSCDVWWGNSHPNAWRRHVAARFLSPTQGVWSGHPGAQEVWASLGASFRKGHILVWVWPIAILLEYVWISVSGVFGYCVDMLDLLGFGCCYSCYMCLICLGVRSHTSLIDPDLNLCSVLLVMFQAQLGYYAQSHDPQTFWALATCFQEKSPHWWPVPQRICPSFIPGSWACERREVCRHRGESWPLQRQGIGEQRKLLPGAIFSGA